MQDMELAFFMFEKRRHTGYETSLNYAWWIISVKQQRFLERKLTTEYIKNIEVYFLSCHAENMKY